MKVSELSKKWWKIIERIALRVEEGKSIQLFCWCSPQSCHCDIIKREALKLVKQHENCK